MTIVNKKEPVILFFGDLIFLFLALWLTLVFRNLEFPSPALLMDHIQPFSIIFLFWILIFYIAGLYEKHTLILKKNLPNVLLNAQIINIAVAIVFFYFIPYFNITPKIILFIYLFISFALILLWRLKIFSHFGSKIKQNAILIASGEEARELNYEVNNNNRYDFNFAEFIDLDKYDPVNFQEDVIQKVYQNNISLIVVDIKNQSVAPIISTLYNLLFAKVQFLDKYKVYESIFDRIPLSIIGYSWFLENISSKNLISYDLFKRIMDIFLSIVIGLISLVFYPFVIFLIKIDDGGKIFFIQERIGQNNKKIKILKFRTMSEGVDKKVTKIGKYLRIFRIDELPQLWNVLRGDLSLIGPRPETLDLVKLYVNQVPFYNIRHLIKPGLSGWAQIYHDNHPHHNADVMETKNKLSYDLFYLKNRSIFLDIKIALKTLKTIFLKKGK
jgi:lipopolysaccharide/colanic/teichoic acid biosynthesis glycosyltransferase